jgi:hypothetical protein
MTDLEPIAEVEVNYYLFPQCAQVLKILLITIQKKK